MSRIYSISLCVENTGETEIIHQEKSCYNKMKDIYSVTLNQSLTAGVCGRKRKPVLGTGVRC